MSEDARQAGEALMRAYYAAYNAGDEAALGAILAPDVVLVSAAGTQHGCTAYLDTYRQMTTLFEDTMEMRAIRVEGGVARISIRDRLVAREDVGDFLGRCVSKGEEIVLDLVGTYTIAGGCIARIVIAPG